MSSTPPPSATSTSVTEIETDQGLARVHLHSAPGPLAGLVLGHGAGGGVNAPDLQAATAAALSQGVSVALVEQPYRVRGQRSSPPAPRLDAAWVTVVEVLVATELSGLPLIVGGRSAGARVACRTAATSGALGVVCLAFPLQPPRRAASVTEPATRLPELEAVTVPTLVVQGSGDRFGMPPASATRTVVEVRGDHSLRSDPAAVADAVGRWIEDLMAGI